MKLNQTVEVTAVDTMDEAPEEDKEGEPEEDTIGEITLDMPPMHLKEARLV